MSDKLKELDSAFRGDVEQLLEACLLQGITMVPFFTLRTPAEQARLWRQSRPLPQIAAAIRKLRDDGAPFLASVLEGVGPQNGSHVTNALPGASWHQWGLALDCYWSVDGQAEWSATRKVNGKNGYHEYANLATAQGLDAGGHWRSLKDWPHVQKHAAASPLSHGMSWPEIDRAMQERFGQAVDVGSDGELIPAADQDQPRRAYRSPAGWDVFFTNMTPCSLFRAGMTICADGAPKAYHANSSVALDFLANAGRPGNWWAIVTDNGRPNGNPVVQGPNDPAPGYYVSMTAMPNPNFPLRDPRRYVDATTIPYVVLSGGGVYKQFHPRTSPRFGDVGVVYDTDNGLLSAAMFAELGPVGKIGEASIEVARRLQINSNPKNGGISKKVIVYLVFPGSGNGSVLTAQQIDDLGRQKFEEWGGIGRLSLYSL